MSRIALLVALLALVGCKKELPEEGSEKADKVAKDDDSKKKKKKEKSGTEEEDSEDSPKKKKAKKADGVCPSMFKNLKHDDDEVSCTCEEDHVGGAVYGTGIYTDDSSPCAAAQHAGLIKKSGGDITMKAAKGCESYSGSTANGVTSHGWGKYDGSFYFPDKGDGKCKKSDACPATFSAIPNKDEDTEITCKCAANPSGSVWGSNIYTQDSSICNAAAHNGVIEKADGGFVTARAAPGCKSYTGTSAHGVTTGSWGEYETSFYFPEKGDGICKAPKVSAGAAFAVGDSVNILWNGAWYPGKILAVSGTRYRVHYDGYSASWDEWVTAPRLKKK